MCTGGAKTSLDYALCISGRPNTVAGSVSVVVPHIIHGPSSFLSIRRCRTRYSDTSTSFPVPRTGVVDLSLPFETVRAKLCRDRIWTTTCLSAAPLYGSMAIRCETNFGPRTYLCKVHRMLSSRGRAAIRDRKEARRPSAQIVDRVVISPLSIDGHVNAEFFGESRFEGSDAGKAYSAKAVYICLYMACAVGPTWRRPSFGRGLLAMNLYPKAPLNSWKRVLILCHSSLSR